MIHAFQKNTFYFDDRLPDRYCFCVYAAQYGDTWRLWLVWYDIKTREKIGQNYKWFVDKKQIGHWHYGQHGPN